MIPEWFANAVGLVRLLVGAFGVIVIVWGVIEALWHFVRLRTVQRSESLYERASSIRERLGVHLLLALDIFIGADLIATVLRPDWGEIGVLAVVVAIRVVLSYLLTREIAEAHSIARRQANSGDSG